MGTALAIRGGWHRPPTVESARDRLPSWIWYVAALTVIVRLAGVWPPLRPDEAGFLLVARAWDPSPDSMFGDYWVDRPPLLIALVAGADALGGPYFLRVVGAVGCGLLVVLAARLGMVVGGARAAAWTAVTVAALSCNPTIALVGIKGEQLGMLLVLGSMLAMLVALRRRSWPLALLAGLLAGAAPGLKQNLVSGLVFGAVALIGMRLSRRADTGVTMRIAAVWIAGVAVPVLAQLAWVLGAGVDLSTAWYAVYGFRSDAVSVLASAESSANDARARRLVEAAFLTGIVVVLLLFLAAFRAAWRADAVLAAATAAVVGTEVAMVALGGSYWTVYLFALVPGTALCVAQLARLSAPWAVAVRVVAVAVVASLVYHLATWSAGALSGEHKFTEYRTGEAIGRAAGSGDTLTVFGGRADIQYASGLPSPYPHLWSLPMRTLDPEYDDLVALLDGPRAPTWLVTWIPLGSWDAPGADDLREAIERNYERHGSGCEDRPVYLLRGVERPTITPDC